MATIPKRSDKHRQGLPSLRHRRLRRTRERDGGGRDGSSRQDSGAGSTGDVAYIDGVSELRNRYAHRLENINRPLSAFIASLSPQDFQKIVVGVLITAGEKNRFETTDCIVSTLVAQQVRADIWLNAIIGFVQQALRIRRRCRSAQRTAPAPRDTGGRKN